MRIPTVSRVRFTPGNSADIRAGLLGWLQFVLDDVLLIDSACLRRISSGELRVVYPERRSGRRRLPHPIVCPLVEEVRRGIEEQVLAEIEREVEP